MITQEDINKLSNSELTEIIKMCRIRQKKQGNIILDFFKTHEEIGEGAEIVILPKGSNVYDRQTSKDYTLEDLYKFYTNAMKGKQVPLDQEAFNISVTSFLKSGELKLKNLKVKQKKKPIDREEFKQSLFKSVDSIEK